MKLQLFVIFLLAFMVSAQTWQFATVDITYFGTASLALDSAGNPHICYDTGLPANELMYARFINGNWEVEIVDYAGDVISCTTSLALDSSGNPHISYSITSVNFCKLKHAFWNGSSWEIEVADSISADDNFTYTSLTLDSSDNPHIFYCDDSNHDLNYAFWNGSSWEIEVVDSEGDVGGYISLALDSSDNPHISYFDWSNTALKHAFWNGSSWEIEVVDSEITGVSTTSLALDSSGNPHISYCDYSNYDLKYAFWNGSYWEVEIVDCAGDVSGTTSLALDSSGNPHISFRSTFYPSHLEYAFWNGSYWEVETVDPTIYSGSRSSLALDSSSNPHICYFSYYLGTAQGSLKYAWKTETSIEGGSILPPATLLHSPVPNPFASSTTVTLELAEPGNVRLSVFDLSGRLMETLLDGAMISGVHSAVLEGTGIASGVYLIRLVSGSQATTTRVVLMR